MWGLAAALFQRSRRDEREAAEAASVQSLRYEVRKPQGAPTAALRAFQRFPHLQPKADTIDAHLAWLALHGASIDDADDLADSYLTMCELSRWQSSPATDAEPVPEPSSPPIATPVVAEIKAPRPIVVAPSQIKHEPAYAAQAFVDWARINGHCGSHKAARIGELYAEHCREEGLVPLPTKTFRPALLTIEGVRKGLDDNYPDHLGNRRHRPTIWIIEPLETVSGEIPWTELPRRRVAA